MKPIFVFLLVCVSIGMAIGQVLFRLGAAHAEPASSLIGAIKMLLHPIVLMALVLYGGTTLLYVYVLQNVPLSRAYPFVALAFVFVPLMSIFFLGESISLKYVAGMILIISGLLLTA